MDRVIVDVPHPIDTGHSHTHFLSIREFSCKSEFLLFRQPVDADGMKDAIRRAIRSQYEFPVCLHIPAVISQLSHQAYFHGYFVFNCEF